MADFPAWAVALLMLVAPYLALLALLAATGQRAIAREVALLLPNLARLVHALLATATFREAT